MIGIRTRDWTGSIITDWKIGEASLLRIYRSRIHKNGIKGATVHVDPDLRPCRSEAYRQLSHLIHVVQLITDPSEPGPQQWNQGSHSLCGSGSENLPNRSLQTVVSPHPCRTTYYGAIGSGSTTKKSREPQSMWIRIWDLAEQKPTHSCLSSSMSSNLLRIHRIRIHNNGIKGAKDHMDPNA